MVVTTELLHALLLTCILTAVFGQSVLWWKEMQPNTWHQELSPRPVHGSHSMRQVHLIKKKDPHAKSDCEISTVCGMFLWGYFFCNWLLILRVQHTSSCCWVECWKQRTLPVVRNKHYLGAICQQIQLCSKFRPNDSTRTCDHQRETAKSTIVSMKIHGWNVFCPKERYFETCLNLQVWASQF